jgi:hypothetical protein
MLWGLALVSWFCKHQKEKSSTRRPPTILNPNETNWEQEGDEPHCPDHQNTNVSKEEKERDLEKNAGAQLLTVVVGASTVGLAVHGKRTRARVLLWQWGGRTPSLLSLSPPPAAPPHLDAPPWVDLCCATLAERERIKKRLWEEKERIVKTKGEKKKKKHIFHF